MKTFSPKKAFTLIELLMAMVLVSLIAVSCVWIFQQSLDISSKSIGRSEINKAFRQVQDKIRKDLVDCRSLESGIQTFVMISRYKDVDEFGKAFPQDFLSFATSTVTTDVAVDAFVSYDIVEEGGTHILYRYISTNQDRENALALTDPTSSFKREKVVEGCVQFRVEYLWEDPRPSPPAGNALTSNLAEEKNVPDPGLFMTLHPFVNESAEGRNYAALYNTGGFNGSNLVKSSDGAGDFVLHAGADATYVMEELRQSDRFMGHSDFIVVPNADGTGHYEEKFYGKPGIRGVTVSNYPPTGTAGWAADYNRVIVIRSPNLYNIGSGGTSLPATTTPIDITAAFPVAATWANTTTMADMTTAYSDGTNSSYSFDNKTKWPTYLPKQIRITLKIHNKDRTVLSTHSFIFRIPLTN